MKRVKALYGFSADLAPFAGKSCREQAQLLASWGCTAIFGGYRDPGFVSEVHSVGMKIYAEFGCFVGADWWRDVPASHPITSDGQPLAAADLYHGVTPAIPEVRDALLVRLADFLAAHEVDGVWLDYIRWPCRWESPAPELPSTSFDPITLARFVEDTGIELPGGDVTARARFVLGDCGEIWTRWRCDQITSWVANARQILDRTRPGATLGLFGVPWRLTDFDGAILGIVGQDYPALGETVDVFSPMVYHAYCGRPVEWIGEVTAEVCQISGKSVWPIIQSVDEPRIVSPKEYGRALDVALCCPESSGALVFTLAGALDPGKLAVTRQRFARP